MPNTLRAWLRPVWRVLDYILVRAWSARNVPRVVHQSDVFTVRAAGPRIGSFGSFYRHSLEVTPTTDQWLSPNEMQAVHRYVERAPAKVLKIITGFRVRANAVNN